MSAIFLFSGCSRKNSDVIVTINGKKLTTEDFRYDIYLIESEGNSLDEYYQSKLGISYWDYTNADGKTTREAAKDAILARVTMYEILTDQAKKAGMTLTEDEIAANEASVDSFISKTTDVNLVDSGLTKEMLVASYNRLSLGDKYYKKISEGFTIDQEAIKNSISPEDYHEYKTECIYVSTVKSENQQLYALSEEELNAAIASITGALDKINAGSDIQTVVGGDTKLTYYTRDFIPGDDIPEQEYKDAAMKLNNNEYSGIVTTNYGYYIIHMLDNNSGSRYEKAIQDAITAEQNKQFETVYNDLKTQYDIKIDTENWDAVTIGSKPQQ
jgi:hypothetical protein